MIPIAISTIFEDGGEYAQAVRAAGGEPRILRFDPDALDAQLAGSVGVLLSGGGDVDPQLYGDTSGLATDIDPLRDTFELALVRRARERGLPTLCICRGLQLANVAFGGSLIPDIGTAVDAPAGALHRRIVDGKGHRGLIPGHEVAIQPRSLLATIVTESPILTSSRHHQSVATLADDLVVVASTSDGVVEAAEARFASPFWLGVQWHPESTLGEDGGASQAIFATFVGVAGGLLDLRRARGSAGGGLG